MKIRVKITRDGSNAVREIDLEEYLKGVVPSEIKAGSCPMEAQKAQAVAARTAVSSSFPPPTPTCRLKGPRWR